MIDAAFVIPGDIRQPTGGYAYDRHVLARLPAHGVRARHVEISAGYPSPSDADLADTLARLEAVPTQAPLLIDGLAYGAMPGEIVGRIRQKIVALVHHPLCKEAGLADARVRYLRQTERMALAMAEHVIVTSAMTGRILSADFAVAPDRITVAEPGTERAPRATGTGTPMHLLAVGSIVPRKGYGILVEALGRLIDPLPWRLTIVGAVRDPAALAALAAALDQNDAAGRPLRARVSIAGALDDSALAALYASTDIFVMPSLYEGYGMVLTEALVRGLPIICTRGVAAAEAVPADALRIVATGDAGALARALDEVMRDEPGRRRMSDAAFAAGQALVTWDETAKRIADVLTRVAA